MNDLVIVATFAARAEAIVARSLLESEGLNVLLPEENVLSTLPHLIMTGSGFRLMVRERDLEAARAILRDAQLTQT